MEKSCPFCISHLEQFGERYIGDTGSFYVVPTLGQISEGGYLLLVSKEHLPCLGAAPRGCDVDRAVARAQGALSKAYATENITLFEHGIVGQTVFHAHLHLIPEAVAIGERVKRDFPNHQIEAFADFSAFHQVYARGGRPYLLWKESYSPLTVCWDPPAPPMYLRIVAAEALGKPERANWRTMDAALDKKLYLETVSRLKPYFPKES